MCGITGIIGSTKEYREPKVIKMNSALYHRGPDDDGWFSDDIATLAMRRLTIIDLEHGSQPKYSTNRKTVIVYNGEIYNYLELKKLLLVRGYVFESNSDTEVLIHLYEEYGIDMLEMLRGMFVFCIYDTLKEKILLARDRFGEKPLFYHCSNSIFSFSSEIGSLLENNDIPRQLNLEVLPFYFTITTIPEPDTLLKDIYSLQPGNYLVYENDQISINSFFELDYSLGSNVIYSMEEAVSNASPIFEKAVKRQMISDVPLGAFLSGGIDSSAVVAQMQMVSSSPVSTFNVKFEDATYDESKIARMVAEKLGTDHHEIVIPNATFTEEIFHDIIQHVGFPFVDSSAIPSYYVTKEIVKHVKVALSGDGGDELFGGYPVFDWYKRVKNLPFPGMLSSPTANILIYLAKAPGLRNSSKYRQLVKGLKLSSYNKFELPFHLHSHFSIKELNEFNLAKFSFGHASLFPSKADTWTDLRKIMYYRMKVNLPLDMLVKVDRMSMANSLEVRAPFLDPDLFDFSTRLDDKLIRLNGTGKLVIREMMKNILPDEVFNHPKSGFSIPLHNYQNTEFKKLASKMLDNQELKQIVPDSILNETLKIGLENKNDNGTISVYQAAHRLWMLMQLGGWLERFKVAI